MRLFRLFLSCENLRVASQGAPRSTTQQGSTRIIASSRIPATQAQTKEPVRKRTDGETQTHRQRDGEMDRGTRKRTLELAVKYLPQFAGFNCHARLSLLQIFQHPKDHTL